jgi:hypothetical protein
MEFSKSKLADRLVLGAIAHRVSNDNGEAFPSIATISREANVSEMSAHRAITSLQEMGELTVNRQSSPLGTNVYRLPNFMEWTASLHPEGYQVGTRKGVSKSRQGVPKNPQGVPLMVPEPSLEPSLEPSVSAPAGACPECGARKDLCMGHRKKKQKTWPDRRPFQKEVRHVQEVKARSTGEDRAAQVRESGKILTDPARISARVRELLSTSASQRISDKNIRAWAEAPKPSSA